MDECAYCHEKRHWKNSCQKSRAKRFTHNRPGTTTVTSNIWPSSSTSTKSQSSPNLSSLALEVARILSASAPSDALLVSSVGLSIMITAERENGENKRLSSAGSIDNIRKFPISSPDSGCRRFPPLLANVVDRTSRRPPLILFFTFSLCRSPPSFVSSRSYRRILDVDIVLRHSQTSSIKPTEDHRLFSSSLSLSATLLFCYSNRNQTHISKQQWRIDQQSFDLITTETD
ncbi:hypothetical protein LWI28_006755 [Acer negundo]|uniref:Uncharacterized protein n=1 Tax=Acer negundo TaxID=4023 RepID=A0AAD5NQV8_ACENE|nr:hypothetical protein LWI28_006755 [Acer negundo]